MGPLGKCIAVVLFFAASVMRAAAPPAAHDGKDRAQESLIQATLREQVPKLQEGFTEREKARKAIEALGPKAIPFIETILAKEKPELETTLRLRGILKTLDPTHGWSFRKYSIDIADKMPTLPAPKAALELAEKLMKAIKGDKNYQKAKEKYDEALQAVKTPSDNAVVAEALRRINLLRLERIALGKAMLQAAADAGLANRNKDFIVQSGNFRFRVSVPPEGGALALEPVDGKGKVRSLDIEPGKLYALHARLPNGKPVSKGLPSFTVNYKMVVGPEESKGAWIYSPYESKREAYHASDPPVAVVRGYLRDGPPRVPFDEVYDP